MDRMLYYPRANPPQDILAQAVLYWDAIGTITPYSQGPVRALTMLRNEGLYQPVSTDRLPSSRVTDVARQIEELLDRMPVDALTIPDGPLTSQNRLYAGKLPVAIEHQLLEYGVVRQDGSFYRGSGELLAPILSIAARAIADEARLASVRDHWVCHTDLPQAYIAAYSVSEHTDNVAAWRLNLGELFPSPDPHTDISELVKFRLKYDEERRRLLRGVEQLVAALGGNGNPNLVPELAAAVDDARREYRAAANARGLQLFVGSLTAAVGIEAGIISELPGALPGAGVLSSILLMAVPGLIRRGPTSPYTYLHRIGDQFQTRAGLSP